MSAGTGASGTNARCALCEKEEHDKNFKKCSRCKGVFRRGAQCRPELFFTVARAAKQYVVYVSLTLFTLFITGPQADWKSHKKICFDCDKQRMIPTLYPYSMDSICGWTTGASLYKCGFALRAFDTWVRDFFVDNQVHLSVSPPTSFQDAYQTGSSA